MPDIFDDIGLHLMTMMLVAFKITQFIDWSWWLVCAPSILGFLLYIFALLVGE